MITAALKNKFGILAKYPLPKSWKATVNERKRKEYERNLLKKKYNFEHKNHWNFYLDRRYINDYHNYCEFSLYYNKNLLLSVGLTDTFDAATDTTVLFMS